MLSLKGLLSVAALAVLIQPAWAMNGDAPGSAPNGTTGANAPIAAPLPTGPGTRACTKVAKPTLSSEERARRKAVRAERASLGVQPRQKTPAQIAARRARTTC